MRRAIGFAVVLLVGGAVAWGGSKVPSLLADLELFRVQDVSVDGVRYLPADEVREAMALSSEASVWDERDPWKEGIAALTLVESVEVRRKLPSTVAVTVTERRPVALLATTMLSPVDADGRLLPIDPSVHHLDLPVVETSAVEDGAEFAPESARVLIREIASMHEADPNFVTMLSEVRWDGNGAAIAAWGEPLIMVRFNPSMEADALNRIWAVVADARMRWPARPLRAVDLRYADQVVARFGHEVRP